MGKRNYHIWIFFTCGVYFSMLAGSLLRGLLAGMAVYEIVTNCILSMVLAYVLVQGVKYLQLKQKSRLQDKKLFVLLFFCANMLLVDHIPSNFGLLWMFPAWMAAMCSGFMQGSVVLGILMAQRLLLHDGVLFYREFVVLLLFGIICIRLVSQPLRTAVLPYVGGIIVAASGVMQILRYHFMVEQMVENKKTICIEECSILGLFLLLCIYFFYRKTQGKAREEDLVFQRKVRRQLSNVLEADYGLLLRLQEYSGKLFMHSMKISRVSAQAARHMGGNVSLAQAGGLYHEIGRITGEKEYIVAGIRLAEEHDFPENLIDIIKQHSTGYDKPKSLEATIVMFTDSIISTSDYLEKKGKRMEISDRRLVEIIFDHRISKGILAESGMTDEEIEQLKLFYIKQYFME